MLFLSVQKSAKAKNVETQHQMLTKDDIFNIVYESEKHIKKQVLLDDGFVFLLQNYEMFYHGSNHEN